VGPLVLSIEEDRPTDPISTSTSADRTPTAEEENAGAAVDPPRPCWGAVTDFASALAVAGDTALDALEGRPPPEEELAAAAPPELAGGVALESRPVVPDDAAAAAAAVAFDFLFDCWVTLLLLLVFVLLFVLC
jgi:hypothetical protein